METKVEQLSVHHWLRQGNDLTFLVWISWFMLGPGAVVVLINLLNFRIPYGRYSETSGIFSRLGLTSLKVPAKIAWFVQELPSFVVPMYCLLNVGGKHVGQFNPNIFLLGMFILHYFNR